MLQLSGEASEGRSTGLNSNQSEIPETPPPFPADTAAELQPQSIYLRVDLEDIRPAEDVEKLYEQAALATIELQQTPASLEKQKPYWSSSAQHGAEQKRLSEGAPHARLQEAKSPPAKPAPDVAAKPEGADEVFGAITMHQQRLGSINFTARTAAVRQPTLEIPPQDSGKALVPDLPSTSPLKALKMAGSRVQHPPKMAGQAPVMSDKRETALEKAEAYPSQMPEGIKEADAAVLSVQEASNAAAQKLSAQLSHEDQVKDNPPSVPAMGMTHAALADRVEDSEAEDEAAAMIEASQPAIFTQ